MMNAGRNRSKFDPLSKETALCKIEVCVTFHWNTLFKLHTVEPLRKKI